MKRTGLFVFSTILFASVTCLAQAPPAAQAGPGGRGGFGAPGEPGPDDKQVFPEPPAGFDVRRENIAHGEIAVVPYDSKSLGTHRQMRVYTPPGYSAARKYPVIYLMHGIGGNDLEWIRACHADIILDNLIAEGRIAPMIAVFPNGNSTVTATASSEFPGEGMGARGGAAAPAAGAAPGVGASGASGAPAGGRGRGMNMDAWLTPFENDLLRDIIPYVDGHYSVYSDRDHRSLAGLSMGGGQALNIGLVHPEVFAYVGGFSSAPDTKSPANVLVPDPSVPKQLKLIWLSSGSQDGLIRIGRGVHEYLKANGVAHVWNVDGHAHDNPEWSANLYGFAQRMFR